MNLRLETEKRREIKMDRFAYTFTLQKTHLNKQSSLPPQQAKLQLRITEGYSGSQGLLFLQRK